MLLCTAMFSVPKAKVLPLQIYCSRQLLRPMWNAGCHLLLSRSSVLVIMLLFDFFLLIFFLSVCSKVVISCNIGEVMWGFFFLLMGWLDCILPGLWCSAMWISVCWVPLYISVTNSKRECASCLPPAADSPQHSTPGKQVNTQPWCREHALLSC